MSTGLPGRIWIMQLPALPSNDTLYRPGYASPVGRHEKVPVALARRGMDLRSHLCRGRHDICAYLAIMSRMPIPTWICPTHDLVYGAKPRHPRGRRKLGEKILTHLYREVLSSSLVETQLDLNPLKLHIS
jgi:hypothetical protein